MVTPSCGSMLHKRARGCVPSLQGGTNFALFSANAWSVNLCLFTPQDLSRGVVTHEIPLRPVANKTGDVWHAHLPDLDPSLLYGEPFSSIRSMKAWARDAHAWNGWQAAGFPSFIQGAWVTCTGIQAGRQARNLCECFARFVWICRVPGVWRAPGSNCGEPWAKNGRGAIGEFVVVVVGGGGRSGGLITQD
jgi:hypothetical protein